MKYAITNTTIVMTDHLIPNGTIIIEDGKIAEIGSPEELIASKGKYFEILTAQEKLSEKEGA